MNEDRAATILGLLNGHRDVHPSVVMRLLLDEIVEQDEQIRNLGEAVRIQAERLEGRTSQLTCRIDKLGGVHGA